MSGCKQRVEDDDKRREGGDGNIEDIIAQGLAFAAGFAFGKRFVIEAEDFGQDGHGELREEDAQQPQPERERAEGNAEVIGNACAEEVGEGGEEEVEGTGEAEEGSHR